MRRALCVAVAVVLAASLAGCKSDPMCIFADDYAGCLVITNNQNNEEEGK